MKQLSFVKSLVHHAVQATTVLELTTQKFIDERNARRDPPIYELDLKEARRGFVYSQLEEGLRLPAEIEDCCIPGGPKGEVPIRIVRPYGTQKALPVVMYFHGGGWVIGDRDTHDRLVREIANSIQAAVVFVEYSRSPEAHYPIALEEAYYATSWVAENGAMLKLDPKRLAVAGNSSGGNLAAGVALLAKARLGPTILFQALFFPTLDTNFDTPSYHEFATGYFVTREEMQWFWEQYAPDPAVRSLPTVAPLQATAAQLIGLPPALITSEYDVLRDEGEAYAHKLMQAGVPVIATRYLGTVHAFVVLNALSETPAARAAISQTGTLTRQMFNRLL